MAEALKDMYHLDFLTEFGKKVQLVYSSFDITQFVQLTMAEDWDTLALKARTRRITESLGKCLPESYPAAIEILLQITDDCTHLAYLFFPDFVEVYGQDEAHWDLSMEALASFTSGSSAEFAVRAFILNNPDKMMAQMLNWASHPNEHIRRLASEGCRPRLPWGQSLPIFKRDPSLILPILEILKDDSSLYVRKSVANNLNDIAKDHPDLVVQIAARWQGVSERTDWIIRHACRTLVRKCHPGAMALFNYLPSVESSSIVTRAVLEVNPQKVLIGETTELDYIIEFNNDEPVHLRVEYGIDFVKAGGKISRKLFLLSDKTITPHTNIKGKRRHNWKNLTTRRHYAGEHQIVLIINGYEAASATIQLED